MVGIYKIKCLKNDRIYIGQSKDIDTRIKTHIRNLNNNIHTNKYLQSDFNNYGEDNFLFDIIITCEDELLNVIEKYYIDKYSITNDLYNETTGNTCIKKSILDDILKDDILKKFQLVEKINFNKETINNLTDLSIFNIYDPSVKKEFNKHADYLTDNFIEKFNLSLPQAFNYLVIAAVSVKYHSMVCELKEKLKWINEYFYINFSPKSVDIVNRTLKLCLTNKKDPTEEYYKIINF